MYNLAGVTFFHITDSPDLIADSIQASIKASGDPLLLDYANAYINSFYRMYNESPNTKVMSINMANATIATSHLGRYEAYWVSILDNYGIKSEIIKLDALTEAGRLGAFKGIVDSMKMETMAGNFAVELTKFYQRVSGSRYLKINLISDSIKIDNHPVGFTERTYSKIDEAFDVTLDEFNKCMYIKYAPSMDLKAACHLTRILSFFL